MDKTLINTTKETITQLIEMKQECIKYYIESDEGWATTYDIMDYEIARCSASNEVIDYLKSRRSEAVEAQEKLGIKIRNLTHEIKTLQETIKILSL